VREEMMEGSLRMTHLKEEYFDISENPDWEENFVDF
jgi:hypothetical protein